MLPHYLKALKDTQSRNASEYSYRTDLKSILKGLTITDEPTKKGKNKIDMEVYTSKGLVSFYIETKKLGEDLSAKKHQEQFERYKKEFKKLVITNFLDFEFYRDAVLIGKCSLADLKTFTSSQSDFDTFNNLLDGFLLDHIKFSNPILLAKKLADKTLLLKKELLNSLITEDQELEQGIKKKFKLLAYRNEFKRMLLNEIDNAQFADLYAQTITYGLFASRYYSFQKDPTSVFKRSDASDLIPNSNPLLKQFFDSISKSDDLDQAINLVIDDITMILSNTDMKDIIANLKLANNDIVIHFYETFLEHYDPALRASMGVWYTPVEVVDYIVKGVDYLLKDKFNIADGISSSEKQDFTYIQNKKTIVKKDVHKVQILDPATGTGNFLNSTINFIKNNFQYPSLWKEYVNKDLIPRLNGFELMMPSYVMAHMKMYELLKDCLNADDRFNIYLTNTLNGSVEIPQTALLSVSDLIYQLHEEALGANRVRQEQPVMVIMGNPPYNGASKNQGEFITDLMGEYYYPNSNGGLNNDYLKFIRYGQHLVDQNGSGVLAYITPNTYLKCITHQNMRKSLLECFDEIYILDFEGQPTNNLFNITENVCVSFFVKTSNSKNLGKVFYSKIDGTKASRLHFCDTTNLRDTEFEEIPLIDPEYNFYPQNKELILSYRDKSFGLEKVFKFKSSGIKTNCDKLVIDHNPMSLDIKVNNYITNKVLPNNVSESVRKRGNSITKISDGKVRKIYYRPFDTQDYFESSLSDGRRLDLIKQEQAQNQVFLISVRGGITNDFNHTSMSSIVNDIHFFGDKSNQYTYPLYQYHEADMTHAEPYQISNFTQDFIDQMTLKIGKDFNDNPIDDTTFSSLDAMDYIYGYLNDKSYTSTYNQFLKSNYPRVPYPKDLDHFESYRLKGNALRSIHLDDLTQDTISKFIATDNKITKVSFNPTDNKLFFNNTSYFDNITNAMWEFKIGASQPLKNWLEARKDDDFDIDMVKEFLNVIYKVRNSSH